MKIKMIATLACLLSIFIIALAGSATAYNSAATHTCYEYQTDDTQPTINGQFSVAEWADAASLPFGTNGNFRSGWTMSPVVYAEFFVETFDTTNDAGDYWEICFDSTTAGGATEPNGGTVPQTDDFKLVVTGHDSPTVQWYKGTGTAGTPLQAIAMPTAFTDTAVFQQAQSLSASPMDSTPHYMWEMHIDKTNTAGLGITPMGYNWAEYIAYYDAHAGGYGLQSWPASPAVDTNPDSWGYEGYSMSAAPEGFNMGIILALSSLAVVVGAVLIKKRASISKFVTV
jgi:hypothetical protein